MVREMLAQHPVIRDIGHKDKVIAKALAEVPGWKPLGKCRRLGRQARWYARKGADQRAEYGPLEAADGVEDLLS